MWMYGYICDMDADTGPHEYMYYHSTRVGHTHISYSTVVCTLTARYARKPYISRTLVIPSM